MRKLYIDLETYNDVPIKAGSYKYAETVEVLLVAYAIDDGPSRCWDVTADEIAPEDLYNAWVNPEYVVIAHNGGLFDRVMLNHHKVLPTIPASRWLDTMVQAYAHGLQGSLSSLGTVYGLRDDEAKLKDGRRLIHMFCKPYSGARIRLLDMQDDWQLFMEYAKRDIDTMRTLHERMPQWNYPGRSFWDSGVRSAEYEYWLIDLVINDRGIQLDADLCVAAMCTARDEKADLDARTSAATDDEVKAATQRDAMLKFILHEYGISLPDMRADTLRRRIADPDLPDALRELLEIRLASSKNTSAKYKAAVKSVCGDGRVRGMHQFCGAARTGRDAGRLLQLQNMARPTMKQADIDIAIEDIKQGLAGMLHDDVSTVLSNCVRGMLVPAHGSKFVVADLSAVEARVLAWLAGERKLLTFFEDYDNGAIQYDQYMVGYANTFGIAPESVSSLQRQLGKVLELSLGYGGGVGAFVTFAAVYNVDLAAIANAIHGAGDAGQLAECADKYEWALKHGFHAGLPKRTYAAIEYLKQKWRESRPKTEHLWGQLSASLKNAIRHKGTIFRIGEHIQIKCMDNFLLIRLPSGRVLSLAAPKVDIDRDGNESIRFMGLDRYSHKWSKQYVHGGMAAGLITQATAACLLRAAYRDAEEDGMPVVLRVHDELVCEVPDTPAFSAARLGNHLTRARPWSHGLPLAATGWEGPRYGKQ
ncbi:dna polymerase [Lasius niger]|uniref:Dna polymerase n=1 Tax=Lasius niger TaxID=67767 RepID=A0A0J7NY70_LASNI|nr:dna polymerase [Lasius niger]